MSHFTKVRTAITDQDRLVAVLRELGFPEVESHARPTPLYGYRGDVRPEKAEVAIRRRHVGSASNDIGFHRTSDGTFEAIISEYDRRKYDAEWLRKVARRYGRLTALAYAEANGFTVAAEETDKRTGEVRLTLRRTVF
ncbi:DUF1257 domain-containing protein [Actinomadura chibensis]|uniref:DUF1257 domain-containing protein n=1 Tax=Actinomadura chibensis TaxID=392828 RepID=A0A5D0NMJ4_9ACTN|nr:DUF1257 domain-containing protein [Actinomadura chibensis]TYB45635.1 DUF1257 domain-containing protein [Actinomadura chibensis]